MFIRDLEFLDDDCVTVINLSRAKIDIGLELMQFYHIGVLYHPKVFLILAKDPKIHRYLLSPNFFMTLYYLLPIFVRFLST